MTRFIPFVKSPPRVAVLRLAGTIASGGRPGSSLNDAGLAPMIERAFRRGRPSAVALILNSPGGAPVQTALIAGRIRRLATERKIPVHAFVEDMAASGGYWLATAADDIWIDESSIVGSIGVISAGFGFQDLISRVGVERRVHTAGGSKSFMDPFRPEKPEDIERLHRLLGPIHEAFKAQVRERRGARLAEGVDLFTGDIWVGRQAVEMGLADGIAHPVPKLKELYGPKVRLIPYVQRRPFLARFGAQALAGAVDAAEERALWSRYGL
ncbi:S49 family peptidase [Halodurantibacterium flavum]|uniref:S49 family peptidase n=1 Tax=Halodurantibacterium flavum TaxID=1382802 RepID=A0ABW4S5E4_9RHOB